LLAMTIARYFELHIQKKMRFGTRLQPDRSPDSELLGRASSSLLCPIPKPQNMR